MSNITDYQRVNLALCGLIMASQAMGDTIDDLETPEAKELAQTIRSFMHHATKIAHQLNPDRPRLSLVDPSPNH